MHFGRDAAILGGVGIAEHEHRKHRKMNGNVQTRTTRPTLMTRLRGRHANNHTVKTTVREEPRRARLGRRGNCTAAATTTGGRSRWGRRTRATATQQRRHVSFGDKISGVMLKLRGSLTNNPNVKVCSFLLA